MKYIAICTIIYNYVILLYFLYHNVTFGSDSIHNELKRGSSPNFICIFTYKTRLEYCLWVYELSASQYSLVYGYKQCYRIRIPKVDSVFILLRIHCAEALENNNFQISNTKPTNIVIKRAITLCIVGTVASTYTIVPIWLGHYGLPYTITWIVVFIMTLHFDIIFYWNSWSFSLICRTMQYKSGCYQNYCSIIRVPTWC